MKRHLSMMSLLVIIAYGCATSTPEPQATQPEPLHGIASWYGEEFAGRTTANGEIFDPTLLTAAHRTLPFGTILQVMNPKTNQSVWVRVNDRGPYIASRIIDLSYAAAQKIGLVNDGVGDVEIKVVKLGNGEREAPAAFDVTIADAPKIEAAPVTPPAPAAAPVIQAASPTVQAEAPAVEFPLPVKEEPVVVDRVDVETQRGGVVTRKQVSNDGKTIEDVPTGEVAGGPAARETAGQRPTPPRGKQFVVQVGAFAVEANAKLLQDRLTSIGQRAWVDHGALFRVRLGPFATRELAAEARQSLEANGLSAIIVSE